MASDFDQTFRDTLALVNSARDHQRRLEAALEEMTEFKIVSHEIIFQSRETIARTEQLLRRSYAPNSGSHLSEPVEKRDEASARTYGDVTEPTQSDR